MHDDLIRKAREGKLWRGKLLDLAAAMPASDEEVGAMLGGVVGARDHEAFVPLLLAALQAGRRVDAAVLVEGAVLLSEFGPFVPVVWKLSGDLGDALVRAVERRVLGRHRELTSLLVAVLWYEREGRPENWPRVSGLARMSARIPMLHWADRLTLQVLAEWTKDKGLRAALGPERSSMMVEHAARVREEMLRAASEEVLALVPAEPPPNVVSGYTMRRAVARIGRNEPCPCGSGKKYKHCCLDKDHERLAHSSSVPGLTVEELKEQRERYVTKGELGAMRSYELVKLDPAKLDPGCLGPLVHRLVACREYERAVEVFEQVGMAPAIEDHWDDVLYYLAMDSRVELLRRLTRLKPGFDPADPELDFEVRFLLAGEGGSAGLELLEAEAALAVRAGKGVDQMVGIAYGLLASRYPHLGILVTRGVLPVVGAFEAEMLRHTLHDTRDRLQLEYGDPIDPVLDLCEGDSPAGGREFRGLGAGAAEH